MNARYFMPLVGRFISPDTIVAEPGNPQSLNRYAYTNNNPMGYTDSTGHWLESALDLAFLAYDIYDIQQNGLTWTSGLSLAADVAGLALPVVTGGGLAVRAAMHSDDVAKIASHADDAVKAVSHVEDVRQARQGAEITQSVLNNIDPSRFNEAGRFGAAFYVAQEGATAVKEVATHGGQASHVIRYQADLNKAKILDLTNPEIAKAWNYADDVTAVGAHQHLATKAMEQGYNAIKFSSYRGSGYNYALFDNPLNPFKFNEWLSPQMVSPVPRVP